MARLPQSLDVAAPQGQRPSSAAVRPTDFGLGDLAQGVGDWAKVQEEKQVQAAQAQNQQNAVKAADILRPYQAKFETDLAAAAQTDAADKPNFAAATLARLDDHFMAVANSGDEGVQRAMRAQLEQYRANIGRNAIEVQSGRRAQLTAAQVQEKQTAQSGQLVTAFLDDYAKRKQALTDGFDGSRPGFTGDITAAHQESATALLDSEAFQAASPAVQTLVRTKLDSLMVAEHADALTVESRAHDAYIARSATENANVLVNNILSNPVAYNGINRDLDTALSAIPSVELRTQAKQTYMAQATEARVRGLIQKGQEDQALAELDGGQYDKVLSPDAKAQLLGVARQAAAGGPKSVAQWLAQTDAEEKIDAELQARQQGLTTGFNLQSVVELFSPGQIAKHEAELIQADRQFAAAGSPRSQTTAELQDRLMTPPPSVTDPDYAKKMSTQKMVQQAAEAELKARSDPARWALTSTQAGDPGAQLQAKWQAFMQAPDPTTRGRAGAAYSILSLGLQQRAGIPRAAMRVLSTETASGLVSAYTQATPDRRAGALQNIASTIYALPPNVRMGDGTVVSARQLALRELMGAKIGTADISAVIDLHDKPDSLALYSDATANPTARTKLAGNGQETALIAQVDDQLHDYLQTSSGLPGSDEINAGRRARILLTARHLMDIKDMNAKTAVREAAADLTTAYRFVDNWRIPVDKARQQLHGGEVWQFARNGAAQVLNDLHNGEALLPAPGSPGMTPQQRQQSAADQVQTHGRWVTQEGDGGLQLMIPDKRGYAPVLDRYGRPIHLSWDQLAARGRSLTGPNAWLAPPPNAAAPQVLDPKKAAGAFSRAIEWKETGGRPIQTSPAGALGAMQLMPATAQAAAKRLGIAYEPDRVLQDPAYNRRLGNEEIRFLSDRYGGNIALIAAAYNAGPSVVDKWIKTYGDPRHGHVTADDFVARIPYRETRDYVRSVLPRAVTNLKG